METLIEEKSTTLIQPVFMTEEEFLEFCDEDIKAEYINGEVIVHSPASFKHEDISDFLHSIIRLFNEQNRLGIKPGSNFQIRLRSGLRRIPDLMFISKGNKGQLKRTEFDGAPDLVVEIVSPDSVVRDWREKYFEYEAAGVKEYWVIDPGNEKMEIYCLNEQGKYERQKPENGVLKSKVLSNFWLKTEWLWQETLPNVVDLAKELKIKI